MGKFIINKYTCKRFIAYIIDWYLASIVSMIPFLIIGLANDIDYVNVMNFKLYTNQDLMIGLFMSIFISFIYFFMIPSKLYLGQTIGKRIMNLKIIACGNHQLRMRDLFVRQIVFIWFIEMSLHSIGGILNQVRFNIIQVDAIIYYKELSIFIIIISILMLLISSHHVTLHDFVSKTKVIDMSA